MVGGTCDGYASWEAAIAQQPATPIADEHRGRRPALLVGHDRAAEGREAPACSAQPIGTPPALVALLKGLYGVDERHASISRRRRSTTPRRCASACRRQRLGGTCVLMEHFDAVAALRADRAPPRDAQPVGADDVRAHAEAPRGGAAAPRRLEPARRDPRRRALPDSGEGADDRVVGPGALRVLRRHRGQRLHVDQLARVARAQGLGRARRSTRKLHILDDEGKELPPGEPGGDLLRGRRDRSSTTTRPRRRPSSRTPQGWSTLGDIGYVDAEGYLYLTDRKANMIISGGVNIYPQEAENLLVTHPKVADVAVFGIPNEDFGEEVKAVVQPVDMADAGPDARARADRLLPAPAREAQVPAQHRLRGRAAAPSDRQALQAPAARSLLGQARLADRVRRPP